MMMMQLQGQHQQVEQQRERLRGTYKSCDFCAKSRKRCDGLLPRCSLCTAKNKPQCRYRPKKLSIKSQLKAIAAARRRVSGCAKRPVDAAKPEVGEVMKSTSIGSSATNWWSFTSLKRCRLSPSPATGLVGMQENAFLNDYFGCLGFLPLATASVVRQAMVKIMLGTVPRQANESVCGKAGSCAGEGGGDVPQDGRQGGWEQALAHQDGARDASKCVLWSAIALGALVQGCSLESVTGYVKLAKDSLVEECSSEATVEKARAYLVLAFLYNFLGDPRERRRHLGLAKTVLEGLPPNAAPNDMLDMLHTEGYNAKLFIKGWGGSSVDAKPKTYVEDIDHIPAAATDTVNEYHTYVQGGIGIRMLPYYVAVDHAVLEKDLSELLFVTDRRLTKAILEDMRIQSGMEHTGDTQDVREWPGRHRSAPLRLNSSVRKGGQNGNHGDLPPAGTRTKAFIANVLPELARISSVIGRSVACSGVGGFLFHSNMAYMNLIVGDMDGVFRSIKCFTRVIVRFPGICRYRPHLVHSVIATAASSLCKEVYGPLTVVYNSVLPRHCTPAPPLEEWCGVRSICPGFFCRSFQFELDRVGFGPSSFPSAKDDDAAAGAPRGPLSGVLESPTAEATHRPSHYLDDGAKSLAVASKATVRVVAEPLTSLVLAKPTPQHTAVVGAGRWVSYGVEEKHVTHATPSVNGQVCSSACGINRDASTVSAGDYSRMPALGPTNAGVDVNVTRDSHCEDAPLNEGFPFTVREHTAASECHVDRVAGPSIISDDGVQGGCGVVDRVDDMTFVDNVTESDVGLSGEECQWSGIHLTDEDLEDAAEALMCSSLLHEEPSGAIGGCL